MAAEPLRPEVVGCAGLGDRRDASIAGRTIACELTQAQYEAIAGQRAARQLALMRMRLLHLETFPGKTQPAVRTALAERHGEPLGRDRAPVFQAGVADVERPHCRGSCQLSCDPLGVGIALAHAQQRMRPCSSRSESQDFFDDEIFRLDAQPGASGRQGPCTRRIQRKRLPALRDAQRGTIRTVA